MTKLVNFVDAVVRPINFDEKFVVGGTFEKPKPMPKRLERSRIKDLEQLFHVFDRLWSSFDIRNFAMKQTTLNQVAGKASNLLIGFLVIKVVGLLVVPFFWDPEVPILSEDHYLVDYRKYKGSILTGNETFSVRIFSFWFFLLGVVSLFRWHGGNTDT